jgi:hypothetical protein
MLTSKSDIQLLHILSLLKESWGSSKFLNGGPLYCRAVKGNIVNTVIIRFIKEMISIGEEKLDL